MRGSQRHTIDAKNRLFVPAKYREELGTNVILVMNFSASSVSVYSEANIGDLDAKIRGLDEEENHDEYMWYYANTEDAEIDSQGRLALPQKFITHANISKNIVSIGLGNHMEIWDADAFDAKMAGIGPDMVQRKVIESSKKTTS